MGIARTIGKPLGAVGLTASITRSPRPASQYPFPDLLIAGDWLRDRQFPTCLQLRVTKVSFSISLRAKTELSEIFAKHSDDSFEFSRTAVKVKLFREGAQYVSRSQTRRIVSGLEKFRVIELDFERIKAIG